MIYMVWWFLIKYLQCMFPFPFLTVVNSNLQWLRHSMLSTTTYVLGPPLIAEPHYFGKGGTGM